MLLNLHEIVLFTIVFIVHVYQVVYRLVQHLAQSSYIPTCCGGGRHHHQGRQHYRPKNSCIRKYHLVTNTSLYFASPLENSH
jgi:hypothetical protein